MIQYIEAISTEKPYYSKVIFLAGGITNCPDWQSYVVDQIKDMNVTVFNPRRKDFGNGDAVEQIKWEYHAIRKSTHMAFWFCKETLCPITLFELGSALQRCDRIIIGCDKEYARLLDVMAQTQLVRPDLGISLSLDHLVSEIRKDLSI